MESVIIFILIAIVAGLLTGLIIANVEKGKLKTVRKNNRAAEYIVQGSMEVTGQNEIFLYKETERTEKPRNDAPSNGNPPPRR